jgi:signal peptidase I
MSDLPGPLPPEAIPVPETPSLPAESRRPVPGERSLVAELVTTFLIVLFGTTTLVQAFVIPTGSMETNLLIGDHLLVDKLAYAPSGPFSRAILPYTPVKRGDIVVFRYPVDPKQMYVKRVIGLPGDRLRIEAKTVILNGRPLREPYKVHTASYMQTYRDFFPGEPNVALADSGLEMLTQHLKDKEVVVPGNAYFVLGDNRDSSLDSRYWGFVPRENIVGKPLLIYWSYETSTDRLAGGSFQREYVMDVVRNFFTKTRWNRTLRLVRGAVVE